MGVTKKMTERAIIAETAYNKEISCRATNGHTAKNVAGVGGNVSVPGNRNQFDKKRMHRSGLK
jgi:hypothetical protein